RAAERASGLRAPFPTGASAFPSPSSSPPASPSASPGDVGAPNGAQGSSSGTFGQSALGVPGQPGIGADGIGPGSGASPGSPPAPTPAPTPGQPPPPEPPPFAVTAVSVKAIGSAVLGCNPNQQFTYVCNF